MLKKLPIITCALLFSATIFAANNGVITTNKKAIVVKKSQPTFTLKLPSNATTGYMWILTHTYPAGIIKPVSRQYVAPKKNMPGAPGYELWQFRVTKAGFVVPRMAVIQLAYARPWEAQKAKMQTFEVVTNDA